MFKNKFFPYLVDAFFIHTCLPLEWFIQFILCVTFFIFIYVLLYFKNGFTVQNCRYLIVHANWWMQHLVMCPNECLHYSLIQIQMFVSPFCKITESNNVLTKRHFSHITLSPWKWIRRHSMFLISIDLQYEFICGTFAKKRFKHV